MTILESIKNSIAFIERNLHNDIGVLDVANSVSYSQFYFSREFSRLAHISVYDYILKRKMSESYKELFRDGSGKIVDLAFRYGFQSHEVYTRAFRKMFGENPSEATIFKPFAIFEPIDPPYLDFLQDLKVELFDNNAGEFYFETDSSVPDFSVTASFHPGSSAADLSVSTEGIPLSCYSSHLVLLSTEHLLGIKCILAGNPAESGNRFLTIKLGNLKHKFRVYHYNSTFAFRYFIEHIYDVGEMGSNYILLRKEKDYIDIFIQTHEAGEKSETG